MLFNYTKITSKNNLISKYYSILIYNIQKQNKITSDHDQSAIDLVRHIRVVEGNG